MSCRKGVSNPQPTDFKGTFKSFIAWGGKLCKCFYDAQITFNDLVPQEFKQVVQSKRGYSVSYMLVDAFTDSLVFSFKQYDTADNKTVTIFTEFQNFNFVSIADFNKALVVSKELDGNCVGSGDL
jgi:hypothetical protein